MNATSFSHIRLVLITAVLGVATLGVGFFALGHRGSDTEAASVQPVRTPAAPTFSGAKTAPRSAAKPAAKPAVRPVAKPKTNPAVAAALRAGFPAPVAKAFERNRVVVVLLHAPESGLDRMALKEASAGAKRAGAAFVAVPVTKQPNRVLEKLTANVGLVDIPTTLVLRRPAAIDVRLTGFADQHTVAQAVRDARR